jgi:uncharacterized membrane protein
MSERSSSSMVTVRTAFFSGLLLLAPLVVTVWAFSKIVELAGGTFRPLYEHYLPQSLQRIPFLWDLMATIVVLLLVTLLGFLSNYVFGKYFLAVVERFIERIPGIGTVYNSVKQIVTTFGTQNRNLFNKVVLVQFPREGIWSIGFLTNKHQGEPQTRVSSNTWTVFVPTTPNPTSGFLLLLPAEKVIELDMTVGDGMKMIISGGAVIPPWSPAVPPPGMSANR